MVVGGFFFLGEDLHGGLIDVWEGRIRRLAAWRCQELLPCREQSVGCPDGSFDMRDSSVNLMELLQACRWRGSTPIGHRITSLYVSTAA